MAGSYGMIAVNSVRSEDFARSVLALRRNQTETSDQRNLNNNRVQRPGYMNSILSVARDPIKNNAISHMQRHLRYRFRHMG